MKQTNYFPHDYGARNDEKLVALRAKAGMQGYGLFWCLAEKIAEGGGSITTDYAIHAFDLRIEPQFVEEVVKLGIAVGLFLQQGDRLFSRRMTEHLSMRKALSEARSEAGRRGRAQQLQASAGQLPSKSRASAGKERNKERKKERKKETGHGNASHSSNGNGSTKPSPAFQCAWVTRADGRCDMLREPGSKFCEHHERKMKLKQEKH